MKRVMVCFAMALALVLSACGAVPAEEQSEPAGGSVETIEPIEEKEPFDIDVFKAEITESKQLMYNTSILLGNMGKYEYNFVKALGSMESDSMLKNAYEWLAEKANFSKEELADAHELIRQQYKEIELIEPEGTEAEKLKESYEALYDAYNALHNTVLSPSGSISSFGAAVSDTLKAFVAADDDLALWVE